MKFVFFPGLQTDELCHHGGHCVNTGNAHYCKCPSDYTGSYCESQVDHCEDKPCRNGATCRGYVGGYQCDVSVALTIFYVSLKFSKASICIEFLA